MNYWKPSDPGWHLVSIPNQPWHKLMVQAVEREPTRYYVESETLHCLGECKKKFSAHAAARLRINSDNACPKCGGKLEHGWYTVDLSAYRLHGECSCPHFSTRLRIELEKTRPDTWIGGQYQCKHIQASIALNSLIHTELAERERYKHAPRLRRQEGAGA